MQAHNTGFPGTPSSPIGEPLIVAQSEQAEAKVPVTGEELYLALLQEDASKINHWIDEGLIHEPALRSLEPRTQEPLLVYLTKHPKFTIQNEIVALIKMVPQDLIDLQSQDGETPLLLVAKQPQGERIMDALLVRGADPNASDKDKCTVLMHCIKNSFSDEMVRYLCRQGVYLNAQDNLGRTALHHAVLQHNGSIIPDLIGAGADKTVVDHENKTAIDIAKEQAAPRIPGSSGDAMLRDLQVSQADALESLGNTFGDGFRADLLKASTLSWKAITDTLSYAMSFFPRPAVLAFQADGGQTGRSSPVQTKQDSELTETIAAVTKQPVEDAKDLIN